MKRTRVMWNNLPDVFRTATWAATGRRAKPPWGTDRQSHERRDLKTKSLQIVDRSFISGVLTSVIVMGGYKRSASWDCCHASHLFTRALDGNLEKNKIKWWDDDKEPLNNSWIELSTCKHYKEWYLNGSTEHEDISMIVILGFFCCCCCFVKSNTVFKPCPGLSWSVSTEQPPKQCLVFTWNKE